MNLSDQRYLVETNWLQDHLDAPELRLVECMSLIPNYFEPSAADGLIVESGRKDWEEGHIPKSAFADFLDDLSDRSNERLMYAMPSAEQFSSAMSKLGVGDGTAVVLYDRQLNMWASRLWWMLRAFGFDNAAVLNGGWIKWTAEGRPVSTEAPTYPRAQFVAQPRPELIAAREQVQAAIDGQPDGQTAPLLEDVLKPLWGAFEALKREHARRKPLDLDLPERKIVIDDKGKVADVVVPPRLEANRVIEEFMIQANVAAAETLEAKRSPLIYRVHDNPSPEKLKALSDVLATLSIKLP